MSKKDKQLKTPPPTGQLFDWFGNLVNTGHPLLVCVMLEYGDILFML